MAPLPLPGHRDNLVQRNVRGNKVSLVTAALLGPIKGGVGGGEQISKFGVGVVEGGDADRDGQPDAGR